MLMIMIWFFCLLFGKRSDFFIVCLLFLVLEQQWEMGTRRWREELFNDTTLYGRDLLFARYQLRFVWNYKHSNHAARNEQRVNAYHCPQ